MSNFQIPKSPLPGGRVCRRPQDSLEQLARALASKAKESVGVYEQ